MTVEAPMSSSAAAAAARVHGVVAADRQDGDLRAEPSLDEAHVAEEVGVAGVVDRRAVLELDDPAPAPEVARHLARIGRERGAA